MRAVWSPSQLSPRKLEVLHERRSAPQVSRGGLAIVVALLAMVTTALLPASALGSLTVAFTSPGTQSFSVPRNVAEVTISASGAGGGAREDTCVPGAGGFEQATLSVKPGSQLSITVGGKGGNDTGPAGGQGGVGGGGTGGTGGTGGIFGGGGGGGASTVASTGSPLLVAAGGGGCGAFTATTSGNGGNDGAAGNDGALAKGGGPGTGTGGGAGGQSANVADPPGFNGSAGQGGSGAGDATQDGGGGGGGGGYFGGGGGGGVRSSEFGAGGGGGGSNFVAPGASSVSSNPGSSTGDGQVSLTYTPGCLVPKLKGKRLKRDKKALTKADCRLGKVKGPKDKSAKVTKQSSKPGTVLPPGSKVNVKTK